jgi:hypothetical protein
MYVYAYVRLGYVMVRLGKVRLRFVRFGDG